MGNGRASLDGAHKITLGCLGLAGFIPERVMAWEAPPFGQTETLGHSTGEQLGRHITLAPWTSPSFPREINPSC